MSAEEILRERLKEYRELLEAIYVFLDNMKWDYQYQGDKEIADKLLEKMRENGVGE